MSSRPEDKSFDADDAVLVASALSENDTAFVIGGQALNLWVARYIGRVSDLEAQGPFTSKDIDYFGRRADAEKLAKALGGKALYPDMDRATASTALVQASLGGRKISIDFVDTVLGVKPQDLKKKAVKLTIPLAGHDNQPLTIRVMHPVHCMQSRIYNVLSETIGRRDITALRQLHAAPIVVREYVREALEQGDHREAVKCFQEIFRYLRSDPLGRVVYVESNIDPLDILKTFIDHEKLDSRFRNNTLTEMILGIEKRRSAYERNSRQ